MTEAKRTREVALTLQVIPVFLPRPAGRAALLVSSKGKGQAVGSALRKLCRQHH